MFNVLLLSYFPNTGRTLTSCGALIHSSDISGMLERRVAGLSCVILHKPSLIEDKHNDRQRLKYNTFYCVHGALVLHVVFLWCQSEGLQSTKNSEMSVCLFLSDEERGVPRWRRQHDERTTTCRRTVQHIASCKKRTKQKLRVSNYIRVTDSVWTGGGRLCSPKLIY